jgi:hypothetical protein
MLLIGVWVAVVASVVRKQRKIKMIAVSLHHTSS